MRLTLDNPKSELKPGMFVTVRLRVPPGQWDWHNRTLMENWRDETAADVLAHHLFAPAQLAPGAGLESLGRMASQQILLQRGLVPAIPESAVVDTGRQKVVFVENGPGLFDGVEVVLGPRCGSFYPLIQGPELGQRVVTGGAFLIDAEARLNPAAASLYFGSGSQDSVRVARTTAQEHLSKEDQKIQSARAKLNAEDRRHVAAQEFCPILEKNRLGSMGKPFKVIINNEPVFLCCEGCQEEAVAHPRETLAKVEQLKRRVQTAAKGK
jgi:membrane fusion protein, copper/silver efflux system